MRIGIDPGSVGALVLLDGGEPLEWLHMPVMAVGKGTRVNAPALSAWLTDRMLQSGFRLHAYMEQVGAMPGQGVTSMFAFGHAVGTVTGVLGALGIPCTYVTPQTWKKRAGLIKGAEKDAARSRAIQLWPKWRDLDTKAKGQALADAALIAKFGGES